MAPRGSSEDPKVTALRESRCLNPHPEQVTDPAFLTEEFFDARDAVQVKYEMVRRVTLDGAPVTATAAAFGYSRPSYYQAVRAENLVHGSDQQSCSSGRPAVMITDHVPAVRVPPDCAGRRGVAAVAA